jgi:uncharacterized membrane protein
LLALLIQSLLAVAALLVQVLQTAAWAVTRYLIQLLLQVVAVGVTTVEPQPVVPVVRVVAERLYLALAEQELRAKVTAEELGLQVLEVQQAAAALVA